ncbi:DUF72 domain-containing protein [Oxyplasma meridianum]|uniref:DUF72 domain-containing protein n=1 Tax=Oxyplasma meridianum TaxID=3073602 RepID=A0AAX4NH31_9ARCH
MIRIGCSGWSYPEWSGVFYPKGTRNLFTAYSSFFNTVEINSTFYNFPSEETVGKWIRQVEGRDFLYSVKIPSAVTHDLLLRDMIQCKKLMLDFEKRVLMRLKDAGKLCFALIQISPFTSERNLSSVFDLLEALSTSSLMYAVEPRHRSIYSDSSFNEEIIKLGAIPASLDSPENPLKEIHFSRRMAYLRLHGRNSADWNSHTEIPMARYNYRYSLEEISNLAKMINSKKGMGDIYVYFNNHPNGNAPLNAMELLGKLENSGKPKQRSLF